MHKLTKSGWRFRIFLYSLVITSILSLSNCGGGGGGSSSGGGTGGGPTATLVSISVTPANPSLPVGGTQQFAASGTYSDGTSHDITTQATWSSSSTSVATINSSGLATAVAEGTSTINATSGSISGKTSLTVSGGLSPALKPGEIVSHEADSNIVYHWYSYVPTSLKASEVNYILISGQNGNIISDDYSKLIAETYTHIQSRITSAEQLRFIILIPVIPRSSIHHEIYTINFDRDSLLNPTELSFLKRPDLKINLMIDELTNTLKNNGLKNIAPKVFIEGFSAGGGFVQRYTLMHPQRVQAIALGGQSHYTLPLKSYNGTDMNWPVAINDFASLLGYDFSWDEYKKVPQYLHQGDQDAPQNSLVSEANDDMFTIEQVRFLKANFGETDPVRLQNQAALLQQLGCNVTFKMYIGVGHSYGPDGWNDSFNFLAQYK